jgi:Domain of unknown function (DUF6916)
MRVDPYADGDRTLASSTDNSGRITRRHLFAAGGSAGAAAFVALNPRIAAAASAVVADPGYLRRSTYTDLVGQDFALGWWGSDSSLQLASVSDLPHLKGRDDAFSLIFLGEAATPPEGAEVALSHPKIGRFELFVTPVNRPGGPQQYEAIVNRSVGAKRAKLPETKKPHHRKPRRHRRKNVVREAHHHQSKRAARRAHKRLAKKARG